MRTGLRLESWAATHAGTVRTSNQDTWLMRPEIGLWAVADGAGGHGGGEIASAAVAAALQGLPAGLSAGELLGRARAALIETNAVLRAEAAGRGPRAMLASTVVMLLVRDGHFACLWAGDSRCYLWRGGALACVTRDHSLVQELVDAGEISPADAEHHPQSNVVTRAVGADDALALDKVTGQVMPGDVFLLMSDGITKALEPAVLAETLAAAEGQALADALIALAMTRGSTDNVTALVVRCR
ncbi:PP2C family protein-serine/threonine phosphatase [Elioraea rosea]|uniref:PP2C family protein-serine/threonine phosphatase n=1 Tax=Elioraea rosea TaxID=2492390 RepID=UPI001184826C|nr:PP2C family serine/threonine-protein phosphatase [Elioraea rosea]